MNNIKSLLGIVAILISVAGAFYAMDNYYAKAADVQQMRVDLDYYILSQRAAELQQRMWQLEDRYKCPVQEMPQEVKEEYRKLLLERESILKKIEFIRGNQ